MSSRMHDDELERTLTDIGQRLAYPRSTALTSAVRERIAARPRPSWRDRVTGRSLAPALVTVALLLFVTALALPGVQAAARDFLRLRGIDLFPVASVPAVTPRPSTTASGTAFAPGDRVSLAEARARTHFTIALPASLGQPDEVYVQTANTGEHVTVVYRERPGIPVSPASGVAAVVVELRGGVESGFFAKGIGPDTRIEDVTIDGARGYWLEGAPHFFFYRSPDGAIIQETFRLAGNTLLWERDGLVYRLEAQVSKAQALELAASFR